MSNYKPQEFSEMIGVSVKTKQIKEDDELCLEPIKQRSIQPNNKK